MMAGASQDVSPVWVRMTLVSISLYKLPTRRSVVALKTGKNHVIGIYLASQSAAK